jgi:Na+-transporting methylmalonyl-CoA/oxaloacetate decarboxylase gamma subunit
MIKSDFGRIEVDGREPVIMAEFETLLVILRRVLGEEKYNRALQRANDSVESKKDTETLKNEEKERMAEVIKAILSGMEDK